MSELLPCPFCGAEARWRPDHYVMVDAHDDPNCKCPLGGDILSFYCTPEEWNRRAPSRDRSLERAAARGTLMDLCQYGFIGLSKLDEAESVVEGMIARRYPDR